MTDQTDTAAAASEQAPNAAQRTVTIGRRLSPHTAPQQAATAGAPHWEALLAAGAADGYATRYLTDKVLPALNAPVGSPARQPLDDFLDSVKANPDAADALSAANWPAGMPGVADNERIAVRSIRIAAAREPHGRANTIN